MCSHVLNKGEQMVRYLGLWDVSANHVLWQMLHQLMFSLTPGADLFGFYAEEKQLDPFESEPHQLYLIVLNFL